MDARQTAINSALRRAFEARNRLSISRSDPVNVFDACQRIGIEVRFLDAKSLEGMYCRGPRLSIFLPSLMHRPRGRVSFSCAHELGHHELGHGTRADKYTAGEETTGPRDAEEIAADVFASHFLMPRQAVLHALRVRELEIAKLRPTDILKLAGLFGVGYGSLLWQLRVGLQLIPVAQFNELSKKKPKDIRGETYAPAAQSDLVIVDSAWRNVPVDMEVGEFLAAPINSDVRGSVVRRVHSTENLAIWEAIVNGTTQMNHEGIAVSIRVARKGYVGSLRYRYLPDEDD